MRYFHGHAVQWMVTIVQKFIFQHNIISKAACKFCKKSTLRYTEQSFCSGYMMLLFIYSWHMHCREMNQLWCRKCACCWRNAIWACTYCFLPLNPFSDAASIIFHNLGLVYFVFELDRRISFEKNGFKWHMSNILTFMKVCWLYAAMHTSWTDAWFCCCYRFQFLEILQSAIMVLRSGFNICPFEPWPDAWTDILLLSTIKANRASDSHHSKHIFSSSFTLLLTSVLTRNWLRIHIRVSAFLSVLFCLKIFFIEDDEQSAINPATVMKCHE